MPEHDGIPERLRIHLVRELDSVPLSAPRPVDARYRLAGQPAGGGRMRRLATAGVLAAVAAAVLGVGAFAAGGPPQVVHWLDRLPFAAPAATPTVEPSETPEPTPTPVTAAAEPSESPEPHEQRSPETSEPRESESSTPAPTRSGPEHDGERSGSSDTGRD